MTSILFIIWSKYRWLALLLDLVVKVRSLEHTHTHTHAQHKRIYTDKMHWIWNDSQKGCNAEKRRIMTMNGKKSREKEAKRKTKNRMNVTNIYILDFVQMKSTVINGYMELTLDITGGWSPIKMECFRFLSFFWLFQHSNRVEEMWACEFTHIYTTQTNKVMPVNMVFDWSRCETEW